MALLTLRDALSRLEEEGLVVGEHGRGTFICDPKHRRNMPDAADEDTGFRLLFAANPQPMWVYDLETLRFLEVNNAAIAHYGYSREEFLAMRITDIRPAEDVQRLMDEIVVRPQKARADSGEWRHRSKDGRTIDVAINSHRLPFAGRDAVLVLSQDISERKRAEDALRESEARYRGLFENARDMVYIYHLDGRLITGNKAVETITGYRREELTGRHVLDIIAPECRPLVRELLSRDVDDRFAPAQELELLTKDGRRVAIEVNSQLIMQGDKPVAVQGIARDITDRRMFEDQLKHQALHDVVTGLPNRILLQDRLKQAIAIAQRDQRHVALLLMDLDRFKEINDTFGHHHGDAMLVELGPRLRRTLRDSDTIARLGGDEFAVVLPSADAIGAMKAARKLQDALRAPFFVEGQLLEIGASIGVAVYPEHGEDEATLLRHADVAMYVAKRKRSGEALYAAEEDQYSPARLALIGELRRAIEHGELVLHFQPKIDLRTGRSVGSEALIRWQHPVRGLIPPIQFIPLAEETGLIEPLTHWVLRSALRQCRAWNGARQGLHVAVNLSARSLHDPLLAEFVMRRLREAAVSPNWLEVEVTESAIMADPELSRELLTRLHDLGVKISIDDFGTGYSSFAYLKGLPVDEIKIDRSFVKDMLFSENDAVIVRSVVDLGHNLGMKVVAEGVEDSETALRLTAMGCDFAQGYHFSRPLPAADITDWLAAQMLRATA